MYSYTIKKIQNYRCTRVSVSFVFSLYVLCTSSSGAVLQQRGDVLCLDVSNWSPLLGHAAGDIGGDRSQTARLRCLLQCRSQRNHVHLQVCVCLFVYKLPSRKCFQDSLLVWIANFSKCVSFMKTCFNILHMAAATFAKLKVTWRVTFMWFKEIFVTVKFIAIYKGCALFRVPFSSDFTVRSFFFISADISASPAPSP